jgi:hypothetical protein
VTVELVLHVTRDDDNRLIGSVRAGTESKARTFSGALELMGVLEEVVPEVHVAAAADRDKPASSEERSWTGGIS